MSRACSNKFTNTPTVSGSATHRSDGGTKSYAPNSAKKILSFFVLFFDVVIGLF